MQGDNRKLPTTAQAETASRSTTSPIVEITLGASPVDFVWKP